MLIPICRHGHKVALIADVDSSGVGVNDRQTGIARRHPPAQLSALRTVHLASSQPLESGHLPLCHVILLKSDFRPRLGSACERKTDSPTGSGRSVFKDHRTPTTDI